MRVENTLYATSARLFALFLVAMVVAFWPSYFTRLFEQPSLWFHAHGIALTLWCVLLVLQAQLIRTQRRSLHKQLGKVSYVLAPAVVAISAVFVHYRLAPGGVEVAQLPVSVRYFLALTLNSLALFALFYGLAIYWRRNAQVHARFMIATLFPLFTPVTDRLIGGHFRSLIGLVPRIDGSPVLPVAGFVLADAIVLAFAIWDWRANRRGTFAVVLGALLVYHVSVLTLYRVPAWSTFCVWFLALPLP